MRGRQAPAVGKIPRKLEHSKNKREHARNLAGRLPEQREAQALAAAIHARLGRGPCHVNFSHNYSASGKSLLLSHSRPDVPPGLRVQVAYRDKAAPDGFVGYLDPTLGEQVLDVPIAQGEAQVHPDGGVDHVSREAAPAVRERSHVDSYSGVRRSTSAPGRDKPRACLKRDEITIVRRLSGVGLATARALKGYP
jgi:hypothetical protein